MSGPTDQGRQRSPRPDEPRPSGDHSALAYMASDSESTYTSDLVSSPTRDDHPLPPAGSTSNQNERPRYPHRASTVSSPLDLDQRRHKGDDYHHARSEDLNHSSSRYMVDVHPPDQLLSRSQTYLTASRPTTPASSSNHNQSSSSDHTRPGSAHSHSDVSHYSEPTTPGGSGLAGTSTTHTSNSVASTPCFACGKAMQGAFVRALGTVYHLQCFKCLDCGTVVASKFFPIDGPDGKQHPLCERDYFRRLNLICAKCGMALRGSYITACNKKFHVEHFTCSVCPTLFGPQDSYYEHDGDVYCHFHYSTRFATKCAGCNSAILKQFVEINRNMRDECWHPECYMINKFWNVKVTSRRPAPSLEDADGHAAESPWDEEERKESPNSLKDKQIRMEQQVYRIWTVLSAFEESSAACISDMLRQVSNGQYLEAIRMAEKFILHVEVLFATIDDLEFQFARLKMKGMSHVREARMLCRKTVDLFTLLSHTQETGARRIGMTQELLALVTGLAHYLKILIRIALTGALKLEREQDAREAITSFLDKLHMLAIQGGNPSAKRMMKRANGEVVAEKDGNVGTQGVTYGFKSLAPENAGESPFSAAPRDPALAKVNVVNPPSDLCVKCNQTVEEDCVRLGTYQRWHSHCVQCANCGKVSAAPVPKDPPQPKPSADDKDKDKDTPKLSTARRPPANVGVFVFEVDSMKETSSFGVVPTVILCTEHAHPGCRSGFQAVSRLEQYAFLLNVALRRLYVLLKKRGVVQMTPTPSPQAQTGPRDQDDPYRNSNEINRLKSVHLDRKLSATARVPKRSTIVESPTGKVAHASDVHAHHPRVVDAGPSSSAQLNLARIPKSLQPQQAPAPQQRAQPTPPTAIDISQQGRVIRPPFARNNTEVMIVDDSAPTSPTAGMEDTTVAGIEDGITLADIPQIVEAAQAREQHRSLPRQSSIPYIAELTPLELAIVKHCAVLVLHRSPLREFFDLDEILELVEIKKSSFWKQLFKPGNDKKNVKKKGIFGVPLELLVEREGADSMLGASRAAIKIPSFVDDVISAMRQMDMSIEGIFRRNGNIRRLKELTDSIDRDPPSVDLTQDNPVQLAALLKKFFRDLPDPLMTFKLHRLFIATQSLPTEAERLRMLHMVLLILPKAHRDTMEVLFVFLKWVASFAHMDEETGSKMDLPNLATVICPSILYSRGRDAVRDESFGAIRVVTMLLEHQDEFYCVPEEFLPILQDQEYFANSMELPSKEFLKKVDTYMRLKASGRTPAMTSPILGSAPFNPSATPRPEDMRTMPPRVQAPQQPGQQSPVPQYLERPPPPMSGSASNLTRSGSTHSRQPNAAPPLTHAPFSYPLPSAPASAPQSMMSAIHSPQPRASSVQTAEQQWPPPERQPLVVGQVPSRPASRPDSFAPPRASSEGPHPFVPNGHPQPAVRQRV